MLALRSDSTGSFYDFTVVVSVMENNIHNVPNVASLKVSETNNEDGHKDEVALNCDANQSRSSEAAAKVTETTHSSTMGEGSSLKRPANCVSGDIAFDEENNPAKFQKTTATTEKLKPIDSHVKRKAVPAKKKGATAGRWNATEHMAFLQGLAVYGREWKRVAADIPSRSASQVRSHAQKYFSKLQKDQDDDWMQSNNSHNGSIHGDSSSSVAVTIPEPDAPLSDSVRREAARILAHPETVEAEVRSTLRQLRERYVQLQQRLEERSVGSNANHSAVSAEDEMIAVHVLQGGLKDDQESVKST